LKSSSAAPILLATDLARLLQMIKIGAALSAGWRISGEVASKRNNAADRFF
jgi:hypothetical protein